MSHREVGTAERVWGLSTPDALAYIIAVVVTPVSLVAAGVLSAGAPSCGDPASTTCPSENVSVIPLAIAMLAVAYVAWLAYRLNVALRSVETPVRIGWLRGWLSVFYRLLRGEFLPAAVRHLRKRHVSGSTKSDHPKITR
jgi:hypothetical protein